MGWRCGQLLVMVPAATVLIAAGTGATGALLTAASAVRGGGSLILRLRRGSSRTALDAAAPTLARSLATELAMWGSGVRSVVGASSRCSRSGTSPMSAWILERAATRVVLGGDASVALRRAIDDAVPDLPGTSAAARVAAVFALHGNDAAATAAALERLAAALDEDADVRRQARAAAGEVRISAVAVPCLSAATLAMLLASDPPALAAALSMPLLPLLAAAAVVVTAAAVGTHRLVST
ncbi:MAG TPA: type II secretion system F family protein [Candidatus Dormibacteraeota bacterium]|nr:type II secretion system F family protein [Candidatus Dormibacteraeota bacterium]